jgi:hypothetical protein
MTRVIKDRSSTLSHMMDAGGVPEYFVEIRRHPLSDLAVKRRRSVIVQINCPHTRHVG